MEDAVRIFRLVATEFDVLNDETVEAWLNLTAPLISKKVFGKLYDQAIALLTAHRLKMAGYGDNQYGSVGDALRVGSYTEGETSVSFNVNQGTNLMADAELALTPYGLEYLTLRRLVVISIHSAGESPAGMNATGDSDFESFRTRKFLLDFRLARSQTTGALIWLKLLCGTNWELRPRRPGHFCARALMRMLTPSMPCAHSS